MAFTLLSLLSSNRYNIVYFDQFMLRLNSQHAKTYFNENLNPSGPPQSRQTSLYQYSKESGYDQNPMSSNAPESKLPLYDKRPPFSYRDQPNLKESKKQPYVLNRIDNQQPSYLSRQQGNAQLDRRLSFNQRMTQKPIGDFDFQKNPSRNSYDRDSYLQIRNQKSDYLAKHQKRNQRIRNSLYRDVQPERRELQNNWQEVEDSSRYRHSFNDQQIQIRNQTTRRLNEEDRSSVRSHYSRNNNVASQTRQRYEQRDPTPLLDRRQGASYGAQSDRINEIRRQKQVSYQFTPDKKQSLSSLPGSAQRKQSLIEKSQELQKKLKNINGSVLSTPSAQEKPANPYENRYEYGKRYEGRYQSRPSVFSTTYIDQRQGNTLYDQSPNPKLTKCDSTRFQDKDFGVERKYQQPQESALDKISQLNEKISQRIQSIISNYAKE